MNLTVARVPLVNIPNIAVRTAVRSILCCKGDAIKFHRFSLSAEPATNGRCTTSPARAILQIPNAECKKRLRIHQGGSAEAHESDFHRASIFCEFRIMLEFVYAGRSVISFE